MESPESLRGAMESLLGSPHLDRVSPNGFIHYRCPFCEDTGNHLGVCYSGTAFPIGLWSCLRCGVKGAGPSNLARALGLKLPDHPDAVKVPVVEEVLRLDRPQLWQAWQKIAESASLSNEHRDMLLRRGIEAQYTPGWFTMPPAEALQSRARFLGSRYAEAASLWSGDPETGRPMGFSRPGRLGLLYPSMEGEEGRYLSSYQQGDVKKILRPRGVSTRGMLYYRGIPGEPLVVTEGEIKAEASWQAGISTLGLLGVSNSHFECVQQVKELRPPSVTILFDTDPGGNVSVDMCATRLATRLRLELGEECPPLRRMHLKEIDTGKKVDIDSFLAHYAKQGGLSAAREEYRNEVLR